MLDHTSQLKTVGLDLILRSAVLGSRNPEAKFNWVIVRERRGQRSIGVDFCVGDVSHTVTFDVQGNKLLLDSFAYTLNKKQQDLLDEIIEEVYS